jgi:hypothetical protein
VDIRKSEPWEEKDTEKILWALKALREGGREGAKEGKEERWRKCTTALARAKFSAVVALLIAPRSVD